MDTSKPYARFQELLTAQWRRFHTLAMSRYTLVIYGSVILYFIMGGIFALEPNRQRLNDLMVPCFLTLVPSMVIFLVSLNKSIAHFQCLRVVFVVLQFFMFLWVSQVELIYEEQTSSFIIGSIILGFVLASPLQYGIPIFAAAGTAYVFLLGTLQTTESLKFTLHFNGAFAALFGIGLSAYVHHLLNQLYYDKVAGMEKERLNIQILSVIGHDLRGGIGYLFSAFDYLKLRNEHCLSEEDAALLDRMEKMSTQTLDLLDRLITWGKTRTKRKILKLETLSGSELIEQTFQDLRWLAEIRGITLVNPTDPQSQIQTDASIVLTCLRNLLSNAIKHSPEQKSVSARYYSDQNTFYFEVSNQGDPIPESVLEEFENGGILNDNSNIHGFSGTGTGLFLTKEILSYLNGRLEIKTSRDQGTTVTISIPMR